MSRCAFRFSQCSRSRWCFSKRFEANSFWQSAHASKFPCTLFTCRIKLYFCLNIRLHLWQANWWIFEIALSLLLYAANSIVCFGLWWWHGVPACFYTADQWVKIYFVVWHVSFGHCYIIKDCSAVIPRFGVPGIPIRYFYLIPLPPIPSP